jgi:hypothetical protein
LENHNANEKELGDELLKIDKGPLISLHAISGCIGPKTMCVKAMVGQHELIILIDSGSTHNFVDRKLAQALHLAVTPIEEFMVKVANGERLACKERYDNVSIQMQDFNFSTTLFSLPLHGLDVVLGIQWLEKIGPVVCNWNNMTMEFKINNRSFTLTTYSTIPTREVNMQVLERELQAGATLFAICP